jgi:two-component system sensor histidine kinase UhpB
VQTLLRGARAHSPELRITSELAPDLAIDGVLAQTIYRVIQEAMTNVLRHANADEMHVAVVNEGQKVKVEVSDNGIGMAPDLVFGRGLTGMRERARALGGTFELRREGGRTVVRCCLPCAKIS